MDVPPIATGADQAVSNWSTRLGSGFLVSCLVLSPVGAFAGVLALSQSVGQDALSTVAVVDESDDRAAAGEYAQRVVVTWLSATQESPDALLAMVKDAQLAPLSTEAFSASQPAVAGIENIDGIWSVTVAVTVTDAKDQTARRYYQVPVERADGALSALSLPTPVASPPVAVGSATAYRVHVDPTSPVGQTVGQFISAYLAGSGDVSRYMTPGQAVTPLTPAPYATVDLVDLRGLEEMDPAAEPTDGQQARVLAAATATVTDSQSSLVAYALTLTARAGRWEIAAIDPAPAVSAPGAEPAPGITPDTNSPIPSP